MCFCNFQFSKARWDQACPCMLGSNFRHLLTDRFPQFPLPVVVNVLVDSLACAERFNAEATLASPAYYLRPMCQPTLHRNFSCIHAANTPVCLDFPLVVFQVFHSQCISFVWVNLCDVKFVAYEYLGRYTHRVAISNNRILKFEDGFVTFKWRDYKDSNKQKNMTLTTDEFIRRFLIHVLPCGFTKIRYYGLLSPRNKATKLKLCKKLTNTIANDAPKVKLSALDFLKKLTGKDFTICPCCGVGHLGRASPEKAVIV